MRESQIEAHLVQRVKALGGEVRKVKWINRNHAPDRLVMIPDNTFWAELKTTGEKPTKGQLREHARMQRMGQRVEVIDCLERIEELLK